MCNHDDDGNKITRKQKEMHGYWAADSAEVQNAAPVSQISEFTPRQAWIF